MNDAVTSRAGAVRPPIGERKLLRVGFAIITIGLFSIAGCDGGSHTTTVEGKITFNKTPVTHGVINFQTAKSQPLGGGINPDGTYSFELPPGEYQVRIDSPPPIPEGYKEGDPLPKLPPRLVPEKYASFNSSGLTASVKDQDDPQTIDFNLP